MFARMLVGLVMGLLMAIPRNRFQPVEFDPPTQTPTQLPPTLPPSLPPSNAPRMPHQCDRFGRSGHEQPLIRTLLKRWLPTGSSVDA